MDSEILELKQAYNALLTARDHSASGHATRRAKRADLLTLAQAHADRPAAPAEALFLAGFLALEDENIDESTHESALAAALDHLRAAAAQGHVEAGLALYRIYDGDYPMIDSGLISAETALAALDRALAENHPYAHFLSARHYGRPETIDRFSAPRCKDEARALFHIERAKQADILAAFFLEADWFINDGPGPTSNILAAKTLEAALARAPAVDLLSADILGASYALLGGIYASPTIAHDTERARANFLVALEYDPALAHATMARRNFSLDPVETSSGGGDHDNSSPLRFFADPDAPKNVYFNEPPGDGYDQPFNFGSFPGHNSPLIEDLGNGYALISSPENRDHKPAVRVRIHYPDTAHITMRDRIARMETLDAAIIDEMMQPLTDMPGLADIKKNLGDLINLAYVMKRRKDLGLKTRDPGLHMVFSGSPGTGKTHVARLTGHILYQIGFLESGHVIEAHKSDLTGEYIGWSESKTNLLCQASFGGLLFIDEAYTLSDSSYGGDFGNEVITTLLKMMEDFSDRFVVIAAGYKEKMEEFLRANPGLRSRFGQTITFRNYTPEEMSDIFALFARDHDYTLGDGTKDKIAALLKNLKGVEYDRFGNARGVRNLFDRVIRLQSARVVREGALDAKSISLILPQDIPSDKPLNDGGGVAYFPTGK